MKKLLAFALAAFFVLSLINAPVSLADHLGPITHPIPTTAIPYHVRGNCPDYHINTAIGCIPVGDTQRFAGWFLGWAIGISGGIALLLIVFSGFQIMTTSGDPQKLQSGRELLTAAISGLILIIFSVFLLRLIGVQILNLPGL